MIFGGLALAVAVTLVLSTTLLGRSAATVARDTQSQAIANELELDLLMYNRLSNLYVLTGDPEAESARTELLPELHRLLERAKAYSGSSEEDQLLAQVSVSLTSYLEERRRVEHPSAELSGVLRAIQPALDEAIHSFESLRELNRVQVDRTLAAVRRTDTLADLVGGLGGASLVLGMVLVMAGVRHYIVRPALALHDAMARFRTGEFDARATESQLREMADLARGFNEMADSVSRQRQAQLTFLAGVAHELRNPLNGLKLGLYALEQEQSDGGRSRVRARLDRQVERLARMVEDLLDATRIEAGRLELREGEFDLREAVGDMVHLYAPTSPNHEIVSELPQEAVMVHGDVLRIEQVLSNLLSNAIKFSPLGGVIRVDVATEGDDVLLAVSDQGIGIPPEEIQSVFLPFRRRRPDVAPGAGLGLSVVRRIVAAHGGEIEVESEIGVGSTFRIRLPRRRDKGGSGSDEPRTRRSCDAKKGRIE